MTFGLGARITIIDKIMFSKRKEKEKKNKDTSNDK
jgi:hypothetical protein